MQAKIDELTLLVNELRNASLNKDLLVGGSEIVHPTFGGNFKSVQDSVISLS